MDPNANAHARSALSVATSNDILRRSSVPESIDTPISSQSASDSLSYSSRPTTATTVSDLWSSRPDTASSYGKSWSLEDQYLSEKDLAQIWTWNEKVPAQDFRLVQDLIQQHVQSSPNAPALSAWDGQATYEEIDALSTSLAGRLQALGVGPGTYVPLYFEKSMWTTIAFLAVIKAGGASILLGTSQPAARLKQICDQVNANLVLCSSTTIELVDEIVPNTLVVNKDLFEQTDDSPPFQQPQNLKPSHPVVVTFTSGSTGVPKGAIMTHANICSQFMHQASIFNYSPEMRIYSFASYTFDVVYITILNTLCAGGCICVPSDSDRSNDVEGSFARLKANCLMITPTVLRTLNPSKLSGLKTLVIGGESLSRLDVREWASRVEHFVGAYGPAECSWTATALKISSPETTPSIGYGIGQNTWVVDPDNSDLLVPLGHEGELLLEGPLVGAGYVSNAADSAFIRDPPWLLRGCQDTIGRRGRLYKTGDIVHYDDTGALRFMGRKDAQVKLRGQRIELEEIEFHMRCCLPDGEQVDIEVITPKDSDRQVLVAFIVRATTFSRAASAKFKEELAERLPSYMIPTLLLPIAEIPMSLTGKTDRRQLRGLGASQTLEELSSAHLLRVEDDEHPLIVPLEQQLGDLWAHVLSIPSDKIRPGSNFTDLGGDSLAAIRLMQAARETGFTLPATAVLGNPILRDMALYVAKKANDKSLQGDDDATSISHERLEEVASSYNISIDNIDTLLPMAHFQDYSRAGMEQTPQAWLTWMSLDFSTPVEFAPLEAACKSLVANHDILRTILVSEKADEWTQVVLKSVDVKLSYVETQDSIVDCAARLMEEDCQHGFALGDLCFRFWFIQGPNGSSRFMLRLPHTHYDGSGAILMLNSITELYDGKPVRPGGRFADIVHAKKNSYTPQAMEYWQSLLSGSKMTQIGRPFNILDSGILASEVKLVGIYDVPMPHVPSGFTLATVINACWASTLATTFDNNDVIFSLLSNGRSANVDNVLDIAGPCCSFLPLRVKFFGPPKASDVLVAIQTQYSASLEYENCDVFEVYDKITDWPVGTHSTSILIIQTQPIPDFKLGGVKAELSLTERDWAPCPFSCFIFPAGDTLKLAVQRNQKFLDVEVAERMCNDFAERLREFSA